MVRRLGISAALVFAASVAAQPAGAQQDSDAAAADCRVRVDASPSAWMIQGYDPFGAALPEDVFGVTFANQSSVECRFTPVFTIERPPFGLAKSSGSPIRYLLISLSDSQDVTPRPGLSLPRPGQRVLVLAPNESRTVLYRLAADPDDVKDAGTFTQDVTLEARDSEMTTVGGARLVLGLNVLPSARIGLAGAYSVSDGRAFVDLGELREGPAPVPLQLRVNSTGRYSIDVSSANAGRLRLGASEWFVPYSLRIGNRRVNLSGTDTLAGPPAGGYTREALPIHISVGDVSGRRAGQYSDVISISVAAQ